VLLTNLCRCTKVPRNHNGIYSGVKFSNLAFTLTTEFGTDRPGCDYRNFAVPGSRGIGSSVYPVCMDACGLDPSCQAWNYDYSTSGTEPRCWLKNCAQTPTTHGGTVGGVRLPATMSGFEEGFDRVGCDYRNFSASGADVCSATCARDSACQAWNFDARSGTRTCFLKNCVPAPTVPPNSNNIYSGVKFFP
jgi:hypothetical protein